MSPNSSLKFYKKITHQGHSETNKYGIAPLRKPPHAHLPGIGSAEEVVHPISPVRVRFTIYIGDALRQVFLALNELTRQSAAQKVQELVGLHCGSDQVRPGDEADANDTQLYMNLVFLKYALNGRFYCKLYVKKHHNAFASFKRRLGYVPCGDVNRLLIYTPLKIDKNYNLY